ncbi:hypothetical protein NIES4074_23980 [Cylindrospermum sp. NIES-4074]|nr:hypothetical protein NIES4074_23980 [Cylindrospermum sp. NIES-4074]
MAIPENHSPIEHLHDLVRKKHNQEVRRFFKNQSFDEPAGTPKQQAAYACLMKDEDNAETMIMRKLFFEFDCGHAQSLQTPIYGVPVQELQRDTKFRPQIKLHFREPFDFEKHGDGTVSRVTGEIGFRITNKTSETISRADAVEYARQIKAEFAPSKLTWKKGHFKCTYLDIENGYDLRLFCLNKSEGISTIQSVLKILDKPYSDNNFQFIENTKEFPANPGTHRVYGRTVQKFKQRPIADVKLTHAQMLVYGQIKPVNLVSVAGRLKNAIENI